jgi:predicted porin
MRKSKASQLASVVGGVAVAVSSVMASSVMAEDHGPKVYGRLDIGIQNEDKDSGTSNDVWSIKSFKSRLGVKGEEALTDDFSVIYKYELQLSPDDQKIGASDNKDFLKARNQYVGLSSGFGTLRVGRVDTPTKVAQGKVDVFKDHIGEMDGVFNKEGDNRLGDTINYQTPKLAGGVTAEIALIQGEGKDDLDGDDVNDDGLGDGVSANVIYKKDKLFLSAAVDSDVKDKDLWRLTAQFKVDDNITVGALYQESEGNTASPKERSGFLLSASYAMDDMVFLAQYGDTELESSSGTTLEERTEFSVGVHKNYSKTTTAYIELSDYSCENGSAGGGDCDGDKTDDASNAFYDTLTAVAGIRKNF